MTKTITSASICRIEAYKIDLFSSDTIAFDIELADGTKNSYCEEDREWTSITRIVELLPLLNSEWWSQVAFPAFEENRVLIYDASLTGDSNIREQPGG